MVNDSTDCGDNSMEAVELREEDSLNRGASVGRRAFGVVVVATAAGLAGCSTSGTDRTATDSPTDDGTPTEDQTPTDEPTDTPEPDRSFSEIYLDDIEDGEHGLNRRQMADYKDRIEKEDYESFSHLLEEISMTVGENTRANPKTHEFSRFMKYAIHNDLELSPDEVRVLERETGGGGTYMAVAHRNEDGDWVKDLGFGGEKEESYMKHDKTEDEVEFSNESDRGLWHLWTEEHSPVPGTDYTTWKRNYDKDTVEFEEDDERAIDRANDHIVVGDPADEGVVDYTVPAAEEVEAVMDWHENDTFNREMQLVEEATEAYHNSEEPYILMEMQDGELTATPTEEHHGPGNLYG